MVLLHFLSDSHLAPVHSCFCTRCNGLLSDTFNLISIFAEGTHIDESFCYTRYIFPFYFETNQRKLGILSPFYLKNVIEFIIIIIQH